MFGLRLCRAPVWSRSEWMTRLKRKRSMAGAEEHTHSLVCTVCEPPAACPTLSVFVSNSPTILLLLFDDDAIRYEKFLPLSARHLPIYSLARFPQKHRAPSPWPPPPAPPPAGGAVRSSPLICSNDQIPERVQSELLLKFCFYGGAQTARASLARYLGATWRKLRRKPTASAWIFRGSFAPTGLLLLLLLCALGPRSAPGLFTHQILRMFIFVVHLFQCVYTWPYLSCWH